MELNRIALDVPVVEDISTDPLQQELAVKAERVLGYGLFKEHLTHEQRRAEKAVRAQAGYATFAQTLKDLDIRPLDPQKVKRYQWRERWKMNLKSFFTLPLHVQLYVITIKILEAWDKCISTKDEDKNEFTDFGKFLVCVTAGLPILGIAISSYYLSTIEGRLVFIPCVLWTFNWVYALSMGKRMEKFTLVTWAWNPFTFAQCHERKIPIREFALDTAIRVKERIPNADIFVEALMSTKHQLGDPFLCIRHDGTTFYLEAWDEPAFEKRTVRKS